jgi:hypothetical protein
MALIDSDRALILRPWVIKHISLGRVPEYSVKQVVYFALGILPKPGFCLPMGLDSTYFLSVGIFNLNFILLQMLYLRQPVNSRDDQRPHPEFVAHSTTLLVVPAVKIAELGD